MIREDYLNKEEEIRLKVKALAEARDELKAEYGKQARWEIGRVTNQGMIDDIIIDTDGDFLYEMTDGTHRLESELMVAPIKPTPRYTILNGFSGSLEVRNMICDGKGGHGFENGVIKYRDDRLDWAISVIEITIDAFGDKVYSTDEYKEVTFELAECNDPRYEIYLKQVN